MEIGRHYTERFIREPLFRKRDIEEHKMIGFICRSKSRSSDLRLIKRGFIVYSEGGVMSGHCTMSNRKTSLFSVCFSFLFSYPLFDFLLMDYWVLVSNHDCDFQEARRYSLSFPISVFQKKSTSSLFTFRSFSHIERWIYERMINDIWTGYIQSRSCAFSIRSFCHAFLFCFVFLSVILTSFIILTDFCVRFFVGKQFDWFWLFRERFWWEWLCGGLDWFVYRDVVGRIWIVSFGFEVGLSFSSLFASFSVWCSGIVLFIVAWACSVDDFVILNVWICSRKGTV